MNDSSIQLPVDVTRIMGMLPHRYPFLLVDRVIEITPNESLAGIKNVTMNEPFFQGHLPGHPIMPGVLVIEAMAQAAGLLTQLSDDQEGGDKLYYLVKVDKARFSKTVVPGDQLRLEVKLLRMRRRMGQYECRALVGGAEVASAEILCAERDA